MSRSTSTDGKAPSGWRYGLPVALVAVLGIAITVGLASWQRSQVDGRTDEVVAGSVTGASQRAAQSLGAVRGSMAAFRALFDLSPDVGDQQFSAFARETFRQRSDVEAVIYAPVRGDGLPVQMIVPGGPGSGYGTDLMGIPATAAAVERARDTGQTTIVGHADNPLGGPPALLAYTAVYDPGGLLATSQQRQEAFAGVVVAELQVSKWMQDAVDGMAVTTTSFALVDPSTTQTLWTTAVGPGGDTSAREVVAISEVQQYVVQGAPTSGLLASQHTWRPWAWFLVGLLITAIVTGLMWRWLDTRRINRMAADLHEATERLRFLAQHDALTGLANRDGLLAWLDDWDTRNPDRRLSVLLIDIDGFKEINTIWGHVTGDLVLRQLAHRLSVLADDRDSMVARVGADHFVVMRALDRGYLDGLITTAQTLVCEPIPVGDRDIRLSSSIGIAVRPEDGRSLDTLLMNADIAVRTAKEFVGDKIVRFDPIMAAEGAARRQLGRALRMAARTPADHFYLEYQPQVHMRTGRLVCAEALIRWRDGSAGGGQPGAFLPLATEFGLMPELGRWILEQACRTVKQWRATCEAVIAVNVDTQQLTADFADVVSAALRQTGAEAAWLMVEVTEAAAMGPDAQRQLDRIRALGVAISIDDFGTGFSSLSRLTDLPAQQMKIDKAFVTALGQSNEAREIIRTIVALARTLRMQLLAEGVESTAQARVLMDEGVDIAQGFLFGRAMSADECLQMWHHGVALPLALGKK